VACAAYQDSDVEDRCKQTEIQSTFLRKEAGQMRGSSFVLQRDVTTLVVAIPVINRV